MDEAIRPANFVVARDCGADPDRELIKLSTYLGHSKPDNTYWYIEAVPELLQLASERAEQSLARGLTP